jgi:hypothetical protein
MLHGWKSMELRQNQRASSLLFGFFSRFFYEWVIELFNIANEEYDLIPVYGEIREASKRGALQVPAEVCF